MSFTSPTTRARLRVVVFGAGVMGAHHARVIAELPSRFTLVGVVDVRAAAASLLVASFGGRAFADGDEDAALAAADHIIVATPIEAHARVAVRALEAGKSVLVEKPLAATSSDARALVEAAARYESAGARLFVGHSERFNPAVRALVRALAIDGASIRAVSLTRRGPASRRDARAHGVLLNLGVHDLDLVAYLCGSPCDLVAVTGTRSDGAGASSESADVSLVTRSGARARVRVDRLTAKWTRKLTVQTDRATFEADLLARTLSRIDGAVESRIVLDDEEPLRAQALAVADAHGQATSAGEPREIATGDDGARAVGLAEEAEARIRGVLSQEVRWIA